MILKTVCLIVIIVMSINVVILIRRLSTETKSYKELKQIRKEEKEKDCSTCRHNKGDFHHGNCHWCEVSKTGYKVGYTRNTKNDKYH